MRIAFLGTPDFAATALAALLASSHDIVAVYCQPPKPAGRGQDLRASPVQRLAEQHNISVHTPKRLRDADEIAAFAALELDVAIVAAYGLILPGAILAAPRLGCYNIHASLLPRWRGAAPIQRAIWAGDVVSGITIMRMDEGLDTGPMLASERVAIAPEMNAGKLHDQLANIGAALMVKTLPSIINGTAIATPQPDENVTYAAKITPSDRRIDWQRSATEIANQIRALSPTPGAQAFYHGETLKILAATVADGKGLAATILDDKLLIACGDGALRLQNVQRPGKSAMDAEAFLRGFAIVAGERLE